VVLYYSTHCPHCRKQVEIFGTEFYRLPSVNVDYTSVPPDFLVGVPTWFNTKTKQKIVGYLSREQLEELAGLRK